VATTTRLAKTISTPLFLGYQFEILMWNRVLTATERADVLAYLQGRWGL
jgi:hypothetical protein